MLLIFLHNSVKYSNRSMQGISWCFSVTAVGYTLFSCCGSTHVLLIYIFLYNLKQCVLPDVKMLSSPHKWHIPSYLVDISSSGKIDSITIHQNKAISFRETDRNIDNQCLFTSVLNKCCQHDDWYGDRDTGTWGHGAKSLRIWPYSM